MSSKSASSMYQAELFPVVAHALKKKHVHETNREQFCGDNELSKVLPSSAGETSAIPSSELMPAIPPKSKKKNLDIPDEEQDSWYFVHSPREEYGAEGPYDLEELRNFKKIGVLTETTLMWQNGLKAWLPLQALPLLKTRLVKLPPIPIRNEEFGGATDPILGPPTRSEIVSCEKLDTLTKFSNSRFCSRCGCTAVGHLPDTGEQTPDLMLLRSSVGSYKNASEVLPGLVWIGNSSTGRSKFFLEIGADIIINCTDNLKSPESKPPHYRCRTIPLVEERTIQPGDSPTKKRHVSLSMTRVLELFDQCYDHIEYCRLYPERAKESDLVPPDYKGPVDRYGRPLRSKEDQAIYAAGKKLGDDGTSGKAARILLWSRLGFDRPCALVAAYLIRKWGMTLQAAVDFVSSNRIGTVISPHYMTALEEYSAIHTLGDMLCRDCICAQPVPLVKYLEKNNDGVDEFKAVRVSAPHTAYQEELCKRIGDVYATSPLKGKIGVDMATSFFFHRPLRGGNGSVLMNLKIAGRSLCDSEISNVVELLEAAGVLGHIYALDMSDNRFGDAGTIALCNALDKLPSTELSILNLRTNRIGQNGAEALANLLLPKFSITTLIVSNNRFGDKGGYFIANAMVIAEKDYFEEDLHADADAGDNAGMYGSNQPQVAAPLGLVDEEHVIQNCTVTYLDMSNNNLGGETMEAVSFVLKSNVSLTYLNIDYSTAIKGNDLNHVFNNCRLFNKSLTHLSVADTTRIAVNTFDNAMRIFQGYSILSSLNFARCDLTALHLRKSISKISSAKYLTSLDLSGNKLMDQGVSFLIDALKESISVEKLPLKYLDISNCNLTIHSALATSEVAATKHSMAHLDMSDNDFSGPDNHKLAENFRNSRLKFLGLNRCQLGSKKVEELLSELRYTSAGTCGSVLKTLLLSENNVQDSVDESLYCFLSTNKKVSFLDLGFNRISDMGLLKAKTALGLPTSAPAEVKVSELHINMTGNRCNQYALEFPGKARAKVTYQYGRELFDDPCHHISGDAVNDYTTVRPKYSRLRGEIESSSIKFNAIA